VPTRQSLAKRNVYLTCIHSASMYSASMLSKELVAASAEPLVLTILSRGESYGYAIIQEVRKLSEGKMEWTDGMLYPVLHRLEKRGLIESRWEESETGRKRKYYFIKKEGKKFLADEREQWEIVQSTLAKLWKEKYA
jgi:PadR family transcriptional regulator, regulatory protein PadR